MTSFSDFPIFFAMSLTLNFAAAIDSPWFGCQVAICVSREPGNPASWERLLHLRLFLRGFGVFGGGFRLFVFRLVVLRGLILLLFFVALGRRLVDLLVLARDLDHLLGHLFVDPFDGDEIVHRSVDHGVEVVVAGRFERVRPIFGHLFDVVDIRLGARLGHRFLQHGAERVGNFAFDLFLGLDVDLRADQFGRETDIEPALADGERELVVVDDDVEVRTMRLFIARHGNARDLGRSQRVLRVDDDVFVERDDVDLLAAQLADDGLHARALHADASADRIDVALARHDRDLGALARLADGAANDDGAVVNLRHFHLEELDEEARIGAREDDLRPFRLRVDVDDDGFDAIALRVTLGARLLAARDDALGLAIEVDDHVAALEALDVTVFELAELADEFVVDLLALGLADLLIQDLLGRLRGNATEVFGGFRQRDVDFVPLLDLGVDFLRFVRADLRVRIFDDVDHFLGDVAEADAAADFDVGIDFLRLVQRPLRLRIFDLVLVDDDVFDDVHRHLAADAVDDGFHRLTGFVVLACGGGEGILERFEHALDVDGLLVRQRLNVFTEILVKHGVCSDLHFQPRFFHIRQRNDVVGILFHHRIRDDDRFAVEFFESSDDHMKPPDRLRRPDADEAAEELLVIRQLVKLAIQPGRRDLQLVLRGNDIVDVEKRADLVRNQLAILDRHTTFFVDVDAEQEPMTLLPVLNVNELETFRRNDGLDFLLDPFGQNAHMS